MGLNRSKIKKVILPTITLFNASVVPTDITFNFYSSFIICYLLCRESALVALYAFLHFINNLNNDTTD